MSTTTSSFSIILTPDTAKLIITRNDNSPISKPYVYEEDEIFELDSLGIHIVSDIEGFTVPVSVTVFSDNGSINSQPVYTSSTTISDLSTLISTLTYTPNKDENVFTHGLHEISIKVEGGGVESFEESLKVEFKAVNDPPVIVGSDMEIEKVRKK